MKLYRCIYTSAAVGGYLVTAAGTFAVLERRESKIRVAPATYKTKFYTASASGRFTNIWWLDVARRSGILIHVGNFAHQSRGCLLLGKRFVHLRDGTLMVANSRQALRELAAAKDTEISITIIGG